MLCPTCGGPVEIVDDHEQRRCSGAALGPGLRYLSTVTPAGPVRFTEAVRWTEADAATKTEDGSDFPAAAYAYVPDAEKPSTWKLRLWEDPDTKETAKQVGMALAALSPGGFRGKKVAVPTEALPAVKRKIFAAWKKVHPDDTDVPDALKGTESVMAMSMPTAPDSFNDIRQRVEAAIVASLAAQDAAEDADADEDASDDGDDFSPDVWIQDLGTDWVVWQSYGTYGPGPGLWRQSYTMDDTGGITLTGSPTKVDQLTQYVPAKEARDRIDGRVLEAKASDAEGGRVYGVQIIAYGDSLNGRRYPESVMRDAAPKYEGARAYDHHRTDQELATSTIVGLIGSYRNIQATDAGLQADLHLLPNATHASQALDASLSAQAEGLPPLVGISHDVQALYKPTVSGGKRFMEATEICSVNSTDVVAQPAAGGKATRMVAGGTGDLDSQEGSDMKLKELLAALRAADAQKRAELLQEHKSTLEEFGLDEAAVGRLLTEPAAAGTGGTTGDGDAGGTPVGAAGEPAPVGAAAGAQESVVVRDSVMGGMLVREAVRGIGLDERFVEGIAKRLPDRFTETQLTEAVEGYREMRVELEKEMLGQTGGLPHVAVTREAIDGKIKKLDAMLAGNLREGYRSLKEAFVDITGINPYGHFGSFDAEDFNRLILQESIGAQPYDSGRGRRFVESAQTGTWNLILGDSVTRRMVAEYEQPDLMNWKNVVSSIVPVQDFRTQRLERLGGYGTLPPVNQGAPYQPLTTPTNEEATYAPSKRGGTEDLTLETIANDDLRMVQLVPKRLGLAAAQTLYRFVWDLLITNATFTPDSVALFAAGHNNTDTNALSRSAMDTGRRKMRKQTAYGDTSDLLSIVPKFLITPPDLEDLAWQICTSAVAIPTAAPDGAASNIPNLHQGMTPLVIDYWSASSTTAWFLAGDPNKTPTIELGFYQGRQDPELFVQNDPTVGSAFTADKITWKIRHIYGGTVVDYRALYRGNS